MLKEVSFSDKHLEDRVESQNCFKKSLETVMRSASREFFVDNTTPMYNTMYELHSKVKDKYIAKNGVDISNSGIVDVLG